jgi:starvation-inducible outer membrane lipoprotein
MCEDCEQSMEAVLQEKPKCACKDCRTGGHVLAVNRPAGSATRDLAPWCVACHHFILTGHQTSTD